MGRTYKLEGMKNYQCEDIEADSVFKITGACSLNVHGKIGERVTFKIEGMSQVRINGPVADNASFDCNGACHVTINGKIGKRAAFELEGMSNVSINDQVADDARFDCNGASNLNFQQRPPQQVIDNIQQSGVANINMPGGFIKQSAPSPITAINGIFITNLVDAPEEYHSSGMRFFGGGGTIIGGGSIISNIGTSIISENGIIKVIKNGKTASYTGNSCTSVNDEVWIDGVKVTANDSREVSNPGATSSTSSGYGFS